MALVKIRELIGTSSESFDDALKQVINHELKKEKNVTGVKIVAQSVAIENGEIKEYKVNVKVAYKWEE